MLPLVDHQIECFVEREKEKAKRYYRAVGRIMAYCIIHNYPIPEQVLSPIHRAYLLQGLTPSNENYPYYQLVQDFSRMLGNNTSDIKKFSNTKDGLRQTLLETYIAGMSFALNALKEGITLNGRVRLFVLDLVFIKTVLTIYFSNTYNRQAKHRRAIFEFSWRSN